jgi:hypothetical protein
LLALFCRFQRALGFLHTRCHGNPLPCEAAFFCRRRFGFACGRFGSGAAGSTRAAGFFQSLARRLRQRQARQRQEK